MPASGASSTRRRRRSTASRTTSNVTEDLPLEPLTDYSKYKAMCEEVLEQEREPGFVAVTLRPATVCGYAPRLRLDLTVNILTNHAINNGRITVFGGEQLRPNLHVDDMTDLYLHAARSAGRGDQRQDLERRLSQSQGPRRSPRWCATRSGKNVDIVVTPIGRPSLLSRLVGEDPARSRLHRPAHGRGRHRRSARTASTPARCRIR